jgi:hypothetical protein
MNELDFRKLVRKTLEAQRTYFKTRKQTDLILAKELEKEVWKELEAGPDVTPEEDALLQTRMDSLFVLENDNEATQDQ